MGPELPVPPPPPTLATTPRRNVKAVWSLTLGIIGIWPLFLVASVPALVLGYSGKREIDRSGGMEGGRGLAIAGIVLGWIAVGMLLVFILLMVAYVQSCSSSSTNCG
jgi:hypothetical protein